MESKEFTINKKVLALTMPDGSKHELRFVSAIASDEYLTGLKKVEEGDESVSHVRLMANLIHRCGLPMSDVETLDADSMMQLATELMVYKKKD